MRINFFYKDTKEPVVLQDNYFIDMYGQVYEDIGTDFSCELVHCPDVGWRIL